MVTYVMAIWPHMGAISRVPFCTSATFFSPFKTTSLDSLAHKAEKNGYPPALMFISLSSKGHLIWESFLSPSFQEM